MKITGRKDDWKSEVTIYEKKIPSMRAKVYGKSIEFFTSQGVSKTGVNETLFQMFASQSHKGEFKRKTSVSVKTKKVVTRFETSFYGENLLKLCNYLTLN